MAYDTSNLLPVSASTFEGGTSTWTTTNAETAIVVQSVRKSGAYGMGIVGVAPATSYGARSPKVAVTPGTTYAVAVPTTTYKAGTTVPGVTITPALEWYDAGNVLIFSESAPATALSPNATFSQVWPAKVGEAPDNAAFVTTTLTVAGLASDGSDGVFIDDVELVVAPRIPGNLLPFSVQSFEDGTTGWVPTNATIDSVSSAVLSGTGYRVGRMTATAAGDASISTDLYPVTPGAEYVSYVWATSVGSSATLRMELEWYDAASAAIPGETVSTDTILTADTRYWGVVVGTAPATAASVRLRIVSVGAAASSVVQLDEVSLAVAPNKSGNLLTYNEYSFESAVPPITVGNATWAHDFLRGGAANGSYAVRLYPVDTDTVAFTLDRLIPVTAGETYAVEATVFRSTTSTGSVEFARRVRIDWYDDTGALVQQDAPDAFYVAQNIAQGAWGTAVSETRTAPAGATRAKVGVEVLHTDGAIDSYYVDSLAVYASDAEYTLSVDSANGVVNFHIFYEPSTSLNVTSLSVYRMDEDGSETPVRWYGTEFVNVPWTNGPVIIEDYECSVGTKVWYRAAWYDASGAEMVQVLTALVDGPQILDPNYIWFKSPGLPALSRMVMPVSPLAWSRAARSVSYDVVGRRNPVSVSSVRAGREGTLSLHIWDEVTNAAFNALLDSGLPCLIQAAPGLGVDGNLYVRVGDVTAAPLTDHAPDQARLWTLQIGEIDRPKGGMQGSGGRTWDTVEDLETWRDVFTNYTDWAGVLTGVPKES